METNKKTQAYIIRATPETMDAIASKLMPVTDREGWAAINNARPMDLDAIRLVLEEAKEQAQEYDFRPSLEGAADKRAALDIAIAKLESLTK